MKEHTEALEASLTLAREQVRVQGADLQQRTREVSSLQEELR